jgi:acetoin:2,6-dichlorophenolindophenol oxidoreductase subunit alpha
MQPLPSDQAFCREIYRKMRLIRCFEERVVRLVNRNEIAGTTHEYLGQEAVAVGVCAALEAKDVITSTHRGHGHLIAKGGDVKRMMAELLGRSTGYNRGKGGSMHIADLSLGIYGANGIVGAGVPIAAGAAWASTIKKAGRVAVAFFGDGGVNQGVVHETMNLAGIWRLPLVFVCENNQYAVTTSVSYATSGPGIASRAAGYGFPGYVVDGMDVNAVLEFARQAVSRARKGNGPTLLECQTYRFHGHFTAEHALGIRYRTEIEVGEWKRRDPITSWATRLEQLGILNGMERDKLDDEVEKLLDQAVEYARSSPWPEQSEAFEHMYVAGYPGIPARGAYGPRNKLPAGLAGSTDS